MQIEPNIIHLWHQPISDAMHAEIDYLQTLLSPDEIKRAQRFYFAQHQLRYILTRATLRIILAKYLAIPPPKICFFYNQDQKPLLSPLYNQNLNFNLSHSANLIVYAISQSHQIGIDIEAIKIDYPASIIPRFFAYSEQEQISTLLPDQQAHAFYTAWCKKEAVIKAYGGSLFSEFQHITISPTAAIDYITLNHKGKFKVMTIDVPNHTQYAAALAIKQIDSVNSFPTAIEWQKLHPIVKQ